MVTVSLIVWVKSFAVYLKRLWCYAVHQLYLKPEGKKMKQLRLCKYIAHSSNDQKSVSFPSTSLAFTRFSVLFWLRVFPESLLAPAWTISPSLPPLFLNTWYRKPLSHWGRHPSSGVGGERARQADTISLNELRKERVTWFTFVLFSRSCYQ